MMPKRTFSTGWSCCTCDSLYFYTNKRKNQAVSIPKTKACATNFLENQKFPMDCDAHAFLNCLIIRLILKMTAALSAKTMCNSPFIIAQSPFRAFAVPHACSCQMRGRKYPALYLPVHDPID